MKLIAHNPTPAVRRMDAMRKQGETKVCTTACLTALRGVFAALEHRVLVVSGDVPNEQRKEIERELGIAWQFLVMAYREHGLDLDMHSHHFLPEGALNAPPKEAA